MDTILVTGGAGFIGSNLVERLLAEGSRIIIIDNFNEFYDPAIKESNIKEIFDFMGSCGISEENLKLYRVDIRDKASLQKVFKENSIDMVIHLAAMAGVRPSIAAPELYYDVNVNGTLNLLEECRKKDIKKLVFSSSSSVYGNNTKLPFCESDPVDNPISPYAASKKAGELLCYTYHHLYGINTACLRFFTVYGPRQRPDLAIHKFARLILEGRSIPFYGDGTTARDYTFIDDIVDGIVKSAEWVKSVNNRYEVFNLGESRTVSLSEMIKVLEETLEKKADLHIEPVQPGDVANTYADVTKARTMLGYSPNKEFREGIEDFARWLGKH